MAKRDGLRCLVLGGSGYVGTALCKLLSTRRVQVAFTYWQNANKAEELERYSPLLKGYRVNLCEPEEIKALIDQLGQEAGEIDALVQCAGTAGNPLLFQDEKVDKFLDISDLDWDQMNRLTVKSTFLASRAITPHMKRKGGNLVFVSSIDGIKSVPAPIHYASAKGALTAMTMALAKELGKYRILVNSIAPGVLDGGLGTMLSEKLKNEYLKHNAMNRLGTAEEVAELAGWLVTNNTYVTGQTIPLDGGL